MYITPTIFMYREHISGIYSITNKVTGKKYIGSSIDLYQRIKEHKRTLNNNTHFNQHLQRSWNKYGEDTFEFNIIEKCIINELLDIEQKWIDCTDELYNICPNARSAIGRACSEEQKQKLRQFNKGKTLSKEHKEKIGISRQGRKHSEETKRKISEAHKGMIRRHKLVEEDIKQIKMLYKSKRYNQYEIAEMFDVTQSSISGIVIGKNWNNYKKIIQ